MAIAKDCILWPVRFAASSYGLKVTVNITANTLSLGVTAARNYWVSGDSQADAATDGGLGDLAQMLEDLLDTHSGAGGAGSFTVTVTDQGALSIQNNMAGPAQSWSIAWDDAASTLDPTIFGFSDVFYASSGGLISAPNQTKGIWYSGKMRSTDSRDRQPVLGAVAETISGLARVSRLGLPKKTRELGWQFIPQAKVLDEYAIATEPSGAFESAWIDAISKGYPFRLYENATTRTASSYELYRTRQIDAPMQRSSAPVRFDVNLSAARAD